jgi:hypothetical protein
MPYMSVQRMAAFAPQTAWGTPATTPTQWLQIDSNPGDEPQVTYLENKALYGSPALVYDTLTGVQHTKWSIKGNFFTDTGPYLPWLALGVDTVSGTAAPYTHTVQLLNQASSGSQPASVTFWDIDNVSVSAPVGTSKLIAGALLDSLSFSMAATGALTYSADFVGTQIAEAAAPTTIAFSDAVFLPAYLITAQLNGTAYPVIEEASIDIKRDAKPIPTLDGSPAPYVVWGNGIDVTGKCVERTAKRIGTAVAADETAVVASNPNSSNTMYVGVDGTGIPIRSSELAGSTGKQPDGTAKTKEVKLCVVWTADSRDDKARLSHPDNW